MSGCLLGLCWRCWICVFPRQLQALGRGEMCNPGTSLPALSRAGTLCHPLLSPVRVCQLVVPGRRRRRQTRVRHGGQQVPESRHNCGGPDLNMGFACLLGRGEFAPGMKTSFRGWEREDYGLPSASIFSVVNNNNNNKKVMIHKSHKGDIFTSPVLCCITGKADFSHESLPSGAEGNF